MLSVDVIIHRGEFGDDGDPSGITSPKSKTVGRFSKIDIIELVFVEI